MTRSRTSRKTKIGLALLVILLSSTACSRSSHKPAAEPAIRSGIVKGTVIACIGPLPPSGFSVTLTVDFSNGNGHRVARRTVHASGQAALGPIPFSVTLPVGRYTVSFPPDGTQTVVVTADQTSTIALVNTCI